jgi:hypothetical protein
MGKEAVLDRVMLRAVGRIMRHPDIQSQPSGEVLQRLLEHLSVGGVAASAIAEQQQATGVRKVLAAMLAPPVGDTIAAKCTGVVTGVEVEIPVVPRYVITPMGNQFAFPRAGKIMVEDLDGRLGVGMTVSRTIPEQFLFLGVEADDRIPRRPIFSLELGDVLKLGVPIGVRPQRFLLADLTLP